MENNIIKFVKPHVPNEACNELVAQLKDVVYSFAGRMDIAQTFGVLEIVKQDLIRELM
jgi:hypothetical protein